MITFFSIPRGGEEHIAILKLAVRSWRKAAPKSQVILFGDDDGVARAAKSLRAKHVPEVARNEHGTPLINGVFEQAAELARNEWMMEISGDILLQDTRLKGVIDGISEYPRPFIIGRRWDMQPNSDTLTLHASCGVDYFMFQRGQIGEIPPFAVGRNVYDNWLVWAALYKWNMQVMDATDAIRAVHHYHSWHTPSGTKAEILAGNERNTNEALARATGCNRWSGVSEAQYKIRSNYSVVGRG